MNTAQIAALEILIAHKKREPEKCTTDQLVEVVSHLHSYKVIDLEGLNEDCVSEHHLWWDAEVRCVREISTRSDALLDHVLLCFRQLSRDIEIGGDRGENHPLDDLNNFLRDEVLPRYLEKLHPNKLHKLFERSIHQEAKIAVLIALCQKKALPQLEVILEKINTSEDEPNRGYYIDTIANAFEEDSIEEFLRLYWYINRRGITYPLGDYNWTEIEKVADTQ